MKDCDRVTASKDPRQGKEVFYDIHLPEIDNKYYQRLKEYEDTLLSPNEITDLKKELIKNGSKIEELEKQVKRYELMTSPSEYLVNGDSIIRKYILGGEETLLMPKDVQDYLNMYAADNAEKHQAIEILKSNLSDLVEKVEKLTDSKLSVEKVGCLKKGVTPKFKVGDDIYYVVWGGLIGKYLILKDVVVKVKYINSEFRYWGSLWGSLSFWCEDKNIFDTFEAADLKIKELEGKK